MKYEDQLKDPRWQRRRLEKMNACGFQCEMCGDGEEELNIHHEEYINYRAPWSYDDTQLLCLCRTCHTIAHLPKHKVAIHGNKYTELFLAALSEKVVFFEGGYLRHVLSSNPEALKEIESTGIELASARDAIRVRAKEEASRIAKLYGIPL